MNMKQTHEQYLMELTSLPTAAGREGRVIAWVEAWAGRHAERVELERDRYGNLMLTRRGGQRTEQPVIFAAHMDHPAFIAITASAGREVSAEFRGGVAAEYFEGMPVDLHRPGESLVRGRITTLHQGEDPRDKRVTIHFDHPVIAEAGDLLTWAIRPAEITGDRLLAPACDDLAAVAAALAAFEQLVDSATSGAQGGDDGEGAVPDVRVLLTRAEEIGFIGALGACHSGFIPRGALIVALENSKSFPESPIGEGPIVRVGDRASTFDADLTYRVGKIAEGLATEDEGFKWQRKLMAGGTCEASAYQALGYTATCVCLPLGNYHNMNEQTGQIDAETISLADYHALVRLLVAIGQSLHDPAKSPPLRQRLDELFERYKAVLDEDV